MLIPPFYRWAAIALAVALGALALAAWDSARLKRADAAGYARAQAEYQARELAAVNAARAEEARRTAAVQKEADHARQDLARAQADAAAAADAGQRLRAALAAARRSCPAASGSPAAVGSPPADPTADLLERLQRRLDEAADGIAAHADAARIAGQACQRAYEALTP